MRVVIAEEADSERAERLRARLERDGHEVLAVGTGADVLTLAREDPDVVVCVPGPDFPAALGSRPDDGAAASARRSTFLAQASPLLDASLDLRETIDSLAGISVPSLADLCLVHLVEGDRVRRVAAVAADARGERMLRALPEIIPVPSEPDPVAAVIATRRAQRTESGDVSLLNAGLGIERPPSSVLLVPLTARGEVLGVLTLASTDRHRSFGDDELVLAEDLGLRAALAVDNARLYAREAEIARVLQESLLPERLPRLEGLELGAAYRPAGDGTEVGGDFYDAFSTDDGATMVAIGDVTGKGARAAALTGLTRHTIRAAAHYEARPSGVLHALNRALNAQRATRGRYCTVALARLEPLGDAMLAEVSCAGHPLPLVLRADGSVEPAGRPGTVLGFVDDPDLHDEPIRLDPGDALVFYTDGITEARTPDGLLGDEKLAAMVRRCSGMGANAIAATLQNAVVLAQRGRPRDDVAIAVARVPGIPVEPAVA